jgi:DNA-binding NarL/FixJ family response regulator
MNQTINILVVDDDPDVLFATARIVKSAGYNVVTAATGTECLEKAKKTMPDLILLDVMLPDIDGPEVCRQIKADPIFEGIFVILVSGMRTSSGEQAEGLNLGSDGYIARPISNQELKARLNAFIRILISDRKRAYARLKHSHHQLALKNRIANQFLNFSSNTALSGIFTLLLDEFDSQYGYFNYIDTNGDLVFPPRAHNIFLESQNSAITGIVARENWSGLWGESLKYHRSIRSNKSLTLPHGKVVLRNALIVPLIVNDRLIGQIAVANKSAEFTPQDQKELESISVFIAPILQIYLEKETTQRQLKSSVNALKEKNIALNVLLENRQEDKKRTIDAIIKNHEKLIFPYIERLKGSHGREDTSIIACIIEKNLQESLNSFEKSFSTAYKKFTPMEVQVADFIKAGKTSKDIARVLNLSLRTVGFHRNNIRRKLSISKAKVNLQTHLQSLD